MKFLVVIFLILLAFIGFLFISFVQDEINEVPDTSIFEFSESDPVKITSGTRTIIEIPFEHRLSSFEYDETSLFKAVKNKDMPYTYMNKEFYISVFYRFEGDLVQEDFYVTENDFNLELINKVMGDIVVSLPVGNPYYSWCALNTNMDHENFTTYLQSLTNRPDSSSGKVGNSYEQNLYLIEPDNTGYYRITFEFLSPHTPDRTDSDAVHSVELEFEIIKAKDE